MQLALAPDECGLQDAALQVVLSDYPCRHKSMTLRGARPIRQEDIAIGSTNAHMPADLLVQPDGDGIGMVDGKGPTEVPPAERGDLYGRGPTLITQADNAGGVVEAVLQGMASGASGFPSADSRCMNGVGPIAASPRAANRNVSCWLPLRPRLTSSLNANDMMVSCACMLSGFSI